MRLLPGFWADVAWTPQHGFVWLVSGTESRALVRLVPEGHDAPLWMIDCGTPVWWLRLAANARGDLLGAAQGEAGLVVILVLAGQTPGVVYRRDVPCVNAWCAVPSWTPDGEPVVFSLTGSREYARVRGDGSAPRFPCDETSQGWIDAFAGRTPDEDRLVWTDPHRDRVIHPGVRLLYGAERAGCWFGQRHDAHGGIGVSPQGQPFGLAPDLPVYTPHLAASPDGRFAVTFQTQGERIGMATLPPFPALVSPPPPVEPDPAPAPVPDPTPDPGDPMPGPDLSQTVHDFRNLYGPLMTADEGADLMNRIAWQHRHQGVKLIGKDEGQNHGKRREDGTRVSVDALLWVVNGVPQGETDLLADSGHKDMGPGPSRPGFDGWHTVHSPWPVDPVQPVGTSPQPPTNPPAPPPPPTPPSADCAALLPHVQGLRADVEDVGMLVAGLRLQIVGQRDQLDKVEDEIKALREVIVKALAAPPVYHTDLPWGLGRAVSYPNEHPRDKR